MEIDLDSIKNEVATELEIEDVEKIPEDKKTEFEELVQEKTQEAWDDKLGEIQNTDSGL